ncbi:hypothetical protein Q5741_19340 [Paenibacillus sp. JX-17]|uniref:Transposase n=1 Tax=Paenibacillus lacisoli TaxID=3064525 RepID=A0ABT9CLL4_9BACL|nr:hypothetical protein [Paenibacillus sp. JX-17]MDO7908546.1 hypothetical protein [Paenibacillus sp. JX-17]
MPVETGTQATYYQYRLIKKLTITTSFLWIYRLLPVVMLILLLLVFDWSSILFFSLAGLVMAWLQFVISHSVLFINGTSVRKRWKYNWNLPWTGYMPDQHVGYRIFQRIQVHISWIGLCFALVFLFWSPLPFTLSLIFWHLWLASPKIYVLYRLQRVTKGGMIKFNTEDVSYYQP